MRLRGGCSGGLLLGNLGMSGGSLCFCVNLDEWMSGLAGLSLFGEVLSDHSGMLCIDRYENFVDCDFGNYVVNLDILSNIHIYFFDVNMDDILLQPKFPHSLNDAKVTHGSHISDEKATLVLIGLQFDVF